MQSIYVSRDADGRVVGISATPAPGYVAADLQDPDVIAFMAASDLDLVRVLEDLIDLLTAKGVIRFTDLPSDAQRKLTARKSTRLELQAVANPISSDAIEGL